MQGFKKSIEFKNEEKYSSLDYGTVYYVAGKSTSKLNDYVKLNADRIAAEINESFDNWITCKIVCLDEGNDLFPVKPKAMLYTALLPSDDLFSNDNRFFVAKLNITTPKLMDSALSIYFSTLQEMLDEILDEGECKEHHLRGVILPPPGDHVMYSLVDVDQKADSVSDDILFSITGDHTRQVYSEPSHLEITPTTYRVLLPDYGQEIRFTAQVKALYVLFLNHPEGIRMADMVDHKSEFTKLYLRFTNRSDVEQLRGSVEKLFDVFSPNAMHVKKSQCNLAVRNAVPANMCHLYEIEAVHGLPHKINLDRSLVSMPEILQKL